MNRCHLCYLLKKEIEVLRAQLNALIERKRWRDTENGLMLQKITELERLLSERSPPG